MRVSFPFTIKLSKRLVSELQGCELGAHEDDSRDEDTGLTTCEILDRNNMDIVVENDNELMQIEAAVRHGTFSDTFPQDANAIFLQIDLPEPKPPVEVLEVRGVTDTYTFNDGGRSAVGRRGVAGDCVTRAICIATGMDYMEVYKELFRRQKEIKAKARGRRKNGDASPSTGAWKEAYKPYLGSLGWKWVPLMEFGVGFTHHLNAKELPKGRIIVIVRRHVVAFLDGVVNDTWDCSYGGKKGVYGYFVKEEK